MACKEIENRARLIVGWTIAVALIAYVGWAHWVFWAFDGRAYELPHVVMLPVFVSGVVGFAAAIVTPLAWLAGEFSFCRDRD